MAHPRVTEELVALLAQMADLQVPETSRDSLAKALEEHLAKLRRFGLSDPSEADPEMAFDPRWGMG
jgi:Asp-tRNA(Asn)/Glu-tRNA(Gln) amidotransferase C subunit